MGHIGNNPRMFFLVSWASVKCKGDESPESGTQSFGMFKDQTLSLCFTTILCHIFFFNYPPFIEEGI